MDRIKWREEILHVPVFDTHTHLNMPGVPIPAQNFWDIAHYFWFQEELWSVGYPRNAMSLPEDARIDRFVAAFGALRNTTWHMIVRRIFGDLYGVALSSDADSVRRADAVVRERAQSPDWARSVIDRLAIRRITVNNVAQADYPELPGVGVAVPSWGEFRAWVEKLVHAADPRAMGEQARQAIAETVAAHKAAGIRGMRVEADPFEVGGPAAVSAPEALPDGDVDALQAATFLTHALLGALSEHGMFVQMFLGIKRDVGAHTAMAVNDPRRITNLYPLFDRYACDFELVVGAPQNNLDAAQPARIYPNVYVGGLWWYNFRPSTYNQAMQYRFEAVPARKSAIVASDARCIEWCYGKILLVKTLLADFLYRQVEGGWIDREGALWVAREWLHDAAARRYLG